MSHAFFKIEVKTAENAGRGDPKSAGKKRAPGRDCLQKRKNLIAMNSNIIMSALLFQSWTRI